MDTNIICSSIRGNQFHVESPISLGTTFLNVILITPKDILIESHLHIGNIAGTKNKKNTDPCEQSHSFSGGHRQNTSKKQHRRPQL